MKALILTVALSFIVTASYAQEFKKENYKKENEKITKVLDKQVTKKTVNGETLATKKRTVEMNPELFKTTHKAFQSKINEDPKFRELFAKQGVNIKDIDYSKFSTGNLPSSQKVFRGKFATVSLLTENNIATYLYLNRESYDNVEVTLSAEEGDIYDRDPHYPMPISANIKVMKGEEVLEEGKVSLFTIELYEIWGAERANLQEDKPEATYTNGDPHANGIY